MADFRTAPLRSNRSEPTARKTAGEENFPVASRLVPKRLRPHVLAFYAFVRLADDIADDPHLEPEVKIDQLDALERALVSGTGTQPWVAPALALKASLTATGISTLHARQMLQAFRRDSQGSRCRSWSDLLLYCRYSADPVGRYLLDLHGEAPVAAPAADALCSALQVLNHIQDCRSDWVELGRCYLPTAWFADAGGNPEHLVEPFATPAVRAVIDRTLDHVDALLARAVTLPAQIRDPGLRMEAAVILKLAQALSRELRRRDPLAERVELGALSRLRCALAGVAHGLAKRPRARRTNSGSETAGSTFYWPLRLLPAPKRRAMFAVYGFCRRIDDIADEPGAVDMKRAALADWRRQLDRLYFGAPPRGDEASLLSDLSFAIQRFKLPRAEFDALIDGMAMDVEGPIRAPDCASLTLYCRRVAGAVGMLAVRVFGRCEGRADAFAIALGEALQLTNILRDLKEDADLGRLYLPAEALEVAGIPLDLARGNPEAALRHPGLPLACARVVSLAEQRYAAAMDALPAADRRSLWPAVAMMHLYRRLLSALVARGWQRLDMRPRLSRATKLRVALQCALGRPPRA
ncbi:MAG: hypothetical protein RLY86_2895 [Pseudomonadota bacterium]|jgi:squalene synthase HpnD/squalene synthase HpnC